MPGRVPLFLLLCLLVQLVACRPQPDFSPLTPEERSWIRAHGDGVTIGVSLHYPPYEEFSLEGDYCGLSADYLGLVSQKIGLKFKPVRFRNRQEVLKRIRHKDVDVVAAIERTGEREKYLDFLTPYVSVPAAIITRKEFRKDLTLDKLGGMRIGVTVSPDFTNYLKNRLKVDCEVVPVAGGYIGGLRSLAVGDVDALICDMALASHYIANARISNLRIAGLTSYSIDLCMATRKGMPLLNSIMRKGFALVSPHEREDVEKKWISLRYEPFWTSGTFWWSVLAAVGLTLAGIGLILTWNRSLKRQVAQRTATLSSINRVFLGSLECHTEREVMQRCLDEAQGISNSEYAAWAQVEDDGTVNELLGVCSVEGTGWGQSLVPALRLDESRLRDLAAGRVIQAECRSEQEDYSLHVVAVPLVGDLDAPRRVIAAARKKSPHAPGEVALLAEMLFAFEEALQRKRTEITLHEKERQLLCVHRMEALGTLAGGIAHDFNNILGAIIANGEMVELFHAEGDESLQSKMKNILVAADRGRTLVSQILSFARKGGEETALLTVSPILKETVAFLEASFSSSIVIRYDIQLPEPPVLAEPTQVHQVLMNLCTNAAHSMGRDGGTLSISLHTLERRESGVIGTGFLEAGSYLAIRVADTGTGLDPDQMERIFEPFFTTKAPGDGTGLGLAVVDGIVKSWGGSVMVESEPGRGACFTVLLPARNPEDGFSTEGAKDSLPHGSGSILFVDDEHDLTESYGNFLEKLGYRVRAMTSSVEALDVFRDAPEDIDLVITDFNMPGLRGDALVRGIQALRPGMPVVLCTGFSDSFSENDASEMGIGEYLRKPVSLRQLAQVVRRHMHSVPHGMGNTSE